MAFRVAMVMQTSTLAEDLSVRKTLLIPGEKADSMSERTESESVSPVTRRGRKTTKMSQTHITDSLSLSLPVCTE